MKNRHQRFQGSSAAAMFAAAVMSGAVSPAHAQAVQPFGVPCDSVGVSGIPYVPGVNCRLMAVDGYTRHYIVWVPLGGVPANSPAVFMHHGASGSGGQFLRHLWLAGKGDAGRIRRHLSNRGSTFRVGDAAFLDPLEQLRPSQPRSIPTGDRLAIRRPLPGRLTT